jgi:hypothetical protein
VLRRSTSTRHRSRLLLAVRPTLTHRQVAQVAGHVRLLKACGRSTLLRRYRLAAASRVRAAAWLRGGIVSFAIRSCPVVPVTTSAPWD